MNRLALALLSVLCVMPGVAIAQTGNEEAICRTDPNVFFCDNFEDRALGPMRNDAGPKFKNNGYGTSQADQPSIINTEHFDGSRSLDMVTPQNRASGGFIDTQFPGGSRRTVYYRWYTKYSSNYIWSPVATKHNELVTCGYSGGCGSDNGLFNFVNGNRTPTIAYIWGRTGQVLPSDVYWPQNMNVLNQYNVNQWYCNEVRVTMNSSIGASDGYIQAWIDGVQRMEYPNVRLVNQAGASNMGSSGSLIPSYWNCDQNEDCSNPAYNHPTIHRYVDNMVASTARIGCLGTSPQPPGPAPREPGAPTLQ
jgi:hypothetical protein